MADLPIGSEVSIPEAGSTILAHQLRTGLAVGRGTAGADGPFLYAEFQGPDFSSREPASTTLLFTTQALSDAILHLMRGGVTVFGPAWAHLLSAAFTASVIEQPTGGQGGGAAEPPTGQYL
ncbi:hypothetical protein [Plantactinospora sp. CA-290183]|uniref:hypothetical protein n=1 Tax=Plantactinospora sp. CA-290183 TaxID=3240006 RepID=UPI003D8BEF69